MNVEVRNATHADAEEVSRVILQALRDTNAKDYTPEIIARVEQSFAPAAVLALMTRRTMFVAAFEREVVGTASLDGRVVRSVFVTPAHQGRGIGRALMEKVEQTARSAGVELLSLPSSVTAERFYARLGFKAVRDNYHGEEQTIVMERRLGE